VFLQGHTRELLSGANETSDLAGARPLKGQLEFIVAAENRLPLGMLFRHYGRSEAISIDRASATVGHDAVATADFPVCDMGDAGALAQWGLEPRCIRAVFEHKRTFSVGHESPT